MSESCGVWTASDVVLKKYHLLMTSTLYSVVCRPRPDTWVVRAGAPRAGIVPRGCAVRCTVLEHLRYYMYKNGSLISPASALEVPYTYT